MPENIISCKELVGIRPSAGKTWIDHVLGLGRSGEDMVIYWQETSAAANMIIAKRRSF